MFHLQRDKINMTEAPEAAPSLPMLGMLVDRTSFDETDDYGIDREAIDGNIPAGKLNVPTSTILKNGRVRRRLRWRPKRRNDAGSAENGDEGSEGDVETTNELMRSASSSNASVGSHSNLSHCSRASHRSMHSFSSTQTMQRDNTKNSDVKARRFPLPRPNYPSTFDGVATIGNESTMVHARIKGDRNTNVSSSPSTVFAAADLDSSDIVGDEEAPGIRRTASAQKKRGFPPLFRRKPPTVPRRPSMGWSSGDGGTETPPLGPKRTLSMPFLQPSEQNLSDFSKVFSTSSISPSLSSPHSQSIPSYLEGEDDEDLPVVEQDILENERRVDLRIPEHRQSEPSKTDLKTETRDAHSSPTPDHESQSLALVSRPSYSLKWSNSDTAMTAMANTCVDFLLSADPNEISPAIMAPEIRFTMSEVGRTFSEPCPAVLASESPVPRSPSARKASAEPGSPLSPKSRISPRRLPAPPSFNLESACSGVVPASPSSPEGADPTSPVPSVESQASAEDMALLDVEKNLQAIHDMGVEHLRHREYPEALEVFEEILRGQLTRYGEEHYRVGTALHNIGVVHMKQGDYEEAAHVSLEAVRIRRLSLPADHPDIAVSMAQLGVALLECRKFKKAISHFREALRIRRKCYGPKHLKVAKLLNNIGCALYELNELEVAKLAFEEALGIQRSTLREVPTQDLEEPPNQILLSIASTLSNIGSIKLYWGQHGDASIDLEEALLIQQSVLGDEHPFAKRTEECLEWMESQAADSSEDENSIAAVTSDDSRKGGMHLCTSTALTVDQSNDELRKMVEVFNRNLWSLKNFELTCQGADPGCHGADPIVPDEAASKSKPEEIKL